MRLCITESGSAHFTSSFGAFVLSKGVVSPGNRRRPVESNCVIVSPGWPGSGTVGGNGGCCAWAARGAAANSASARDRRKLTR
jgi:hypothetical protein